MRAGHLGGERLITPSVHPQTQKQMRSLALTETCLPGYCQSLHTITCVPGRAVFPQMRAVLPWISLEIITPCVCFEHALLHSDCSWDHLNSWVVLNAVVLNWQSHLTFIFKGNSAQIDVFFFFSSPSLMPRENFECLPITFPSNQGWKCLSASPAKWIQSHRLHHSFCPGKCPLA